MPDKRLMNARDLVTKTIYGVVEGKKVVIATIYSSASLGREERVERDDYSATRHQRRSGNTMNQEKE